MTGGKILIPEVFDPAQGIFIQAKKFFYDIDDRDRDRIHSRRRDLLQAKRKGQKLWVCSLCQEPVFIAGGLGRTKRRYHFKHFSSDSNCPYQHPQTLTPKILRKIKYNGAKESLLHQQMKESLSELLSRDPQVRDLRIEKDLFPL